MLFVIPRHNDHPELAGLGVTNDARISKPQPIEIFFLVSRFARDGGLIMVQVGDPNRIAGMLLPSDAVFGSGEAYRLLLARAIDIQPGVVHVPDAFVNEDIHVENAKSVEFVRRAASDGVRQLFPVEKVFRNRMQYDTVASDVSKVLEGQSFSKEVIFTAMTDDGNIADGVILGSPQHDEVPGSMLQAPP